MISNRDGHVRVLPLLVANKIAAGEVVERPASVVKELVENAIDAGARRIAITITQGGRKLVSVQDDGCGMTKDDAVLSLERQATSKIRDVTDIEEIDTLGFRGEAIPSIASVSRFTLTTRRADSDEGTTIQVNAGTLAEVRSAGCPPGTLVEVRDLFCNVPARRKFLRAYATEEGHVKQIFTVHALAHPAIAFSLTIDGRELYRLAPAASLSDRVHDLFGDEFPSNALPVGNTQTLKHSNNNCLRLHREAKPLDPHTPRSVRLRQRTSRDLGLDCLRLARILSAPCRRQPPGRRHLHQPSAEPSRRQRPSDKARGPLPRQRRGEERDHGGRWRGAEHQRPIGSFGRW